MTFRDWLNRNEEEEPPFNFEFIGEQDATSAYVPMSTLLRWYLYDMQVTNREELAAKIELPPISEEGVEMEQKDSDIRMKPVTDFESIAQAIAEVNGYIISTIQRESLQAHIEETYPNASNEERILIEKAQEEASDFLDQVGFAACMFMLSVGFKLGLLQPGITEAVRKHKDE